MPRKKKSDIPADAQDQQDNVIVDEREFIIKAVEIKDGKLNYSFEPLKFNPEKGFIEGDTHSVKGTKLIHDDVQDAFNALSVHLAKADDAFAHLGEDGEDIDQLRNDEITEKYHVHGFKMKGTHEEEKVILTGTKYVSVGGRAKFETPPILLAEYSSYKWWNELQQAIDIIRYETQEYMGGKCTPEDEEDEKENPKQTKLQFAQPEGAEDVAADGTDEEDTEELANDFDDEDDQPF